MTLFTWDTYIYFGLLSVLLGMCASFLAWHKQIQQYIVILLSVLQIAVLLVFIIGFWHYLERPPLRTMGETRLWFSFFMPLASLITYSVWRYRLILPYGTLLSFVFILINILKPEIHSKVLMPALQSAWFVPHVSIYMFAYAFFGTAFIAAVMALVKKTKPNYQLIDQVVYISVSLLAIGMLLGALWAKQAWGNYWSWDPKETWAFITWCGCLVYIHLRITPNIAQKWALWTVVFSFIALQICWYGINYLPAAQNSIHTYTRQ